MIVLFVVELMTPLVFAVTDPGMGLSSAILFEVKGPVKSVVSERASVSRKYFIRAVEGVRIKTHEVEYDRYGKVVEDSSYGHYNYSPYLARKDTYIYGSDGRITGKDQYSPDDSLDLRWTYTLDEDDSILQTMFDSNGTIKSKWLWKYDDRGRLIESVCLKPDTEFLSFKYSCEYSKDGHVIQVLGYSADDDLVEKHVYEYNSEGYVERKVEGYYNYKSNSWSNEEYLYKYEYDSYGNWVKRSRRQPTKLLFFRYFVTDLVYYKMIEYY